MKYIRLPTIIGIIFLFFVYSPIYAQEINVTAVQFLPKVELFFTPRSGSFTEGSTFDVPILVNTNEHSINGVEVSVSFDSSKLSIVRPAGGTSIVGIWVEPPVYDNVRGTANYVGVIPGGITTDSGLIGSITFKAKDTGKAVVSFNSTSKVLLHDGLGTKAVTSFGRSEYTILPKAPDGISVFSETHPFQSTWYNNNSPVLSWEKPAGVTGFSYVLDNKPNTIPENVVNTTDTTVAFEDIEDGLWYLHIKGNKSGVWGGTGHFALKVDTSPPADFKPRVNYLLASLSFVERALVTFFTTDNLSGVDHYEVGIIDMNQPTTVSPIFVEADSPFQVSLQKGDNLRVIVRAIDKAGNIRESSINVTPPFMITKLIKDNIIYILLFIILSGLIGLILHYMIGHHIIKKVHHARKLLKKKKTKSK